MIIKFRELFSNPDFLTIASMCSNKEHQIKRSLITNIKKRSKVGEIQIPINWQSDKILSRKSSHEEIHG